MVYMLHAVIINKDYGTINKIMQSAYNIIKKDEIKVRETSQSYRFENINKRYFDKNTYRSKKINPYITLVFGKIKSK